MDNSDLMKNEEHRKSVLRQEIMLCMKANNLTVTGEFWFMLIFRTEQQLKAIARDLHLNPEQILSQSSLSRGTSG